MAKCEEVAVSELLEGDLRRLRIQLKRVLAVRGAVRIVAVERPVADRDRRLRLRDPYLGS